MANKKVNKKRYATHITTPTGERVYVSAKSQEDLDAKVAKLKAEMGAGVDISDNTLFNDYADVWLRVYKKPKLRQNTIGTLTWHLEKNIKPFFNGKTLREIKPIHIQGFLASISGYSYSVQSACLSVVKSIFDTAVDNDLLLKSPVRKRDKPAGAKPKEKEALTNEQVNRLLEATKGTQAYLFCLLALTTGMRKSEILGLMWEDVDFSSGHINVCHSIPLSEAREVTEVTTQLKTEASYRRLPMPLLLRHAMETEHQVSKSPFVISRPDGSHITRSSFDSLWNIVTARTASKKYPLGSTRCAHNNGHFKVTLDFHVHPHLLRHTYITQLFEAGLDIKQVQYLAGHSTPAMTLKVYTHYRRKQREQETADQVNAATAYMGWRAESNDKVVEFKPEATTKNNKRLQAT